MIKLNTKKVNIKPILLLINADTTGRLEIPADRSQARLADYTALKTELQADIIDRSIVAAKRWSRLLSKVIGTSFSLALVGWMQRNHYQAFYCDAENSGLLLAGLFKLTRTKRSLFMIGHWITPSKKAVLIKNLRLFTHITTFFLHSSEQYKKAIEALGIPSTKVRMLPYQVDTEFWKPQNAKPVQVEPSEAYICTAGLEFRDYSTLLEAIKGAPVKVKIGAASHWSKRKSSILAQELPENVEVNSYNYFELRDLYAGSRFVIVPLVNVDFQAGITVILEAMAMGKAVIVTRSQGQGDTVVDRRKTTRDGMALPTIGNLGRFFGNNEYEKEAGQTGFYVTPGDAAQLRRAIDYLLANPERAEEMGQRGRHMVENLMRVEQFAIRIRQVIEEETGLYLTPANI